LCEAPLYIVRRLGEICAGLIKLLDFLSYSGASHKPILFFVLIVLFAVFPGATHSKTRFLLIAVITHHILVHFELVIRSGSSISGLCSRQIHSLTGNHAEISLVLVALIGHSWSSLPIVVALSLSASSSS
jgi:hypothetical protein